VAIRKSASNQLKESNPKKGRKKGQETGVMRSATSYWR
jgi:hypothetical protein